MKVFFLYIHGKDKKDSITVNEINESLSNENILAIVEPIEQAVNLNYVYSIEPFGKAPDIGSLRF